MSEPTLTATAGGTELLNPLLAQWDTSVQMLFDRLVGLSDDEYRWQPTPGAADLIEQALQVGYSSYPVGMDPDLPFVDIVWWLNRELIAHGADMGCVRDLYGTQVTAD